MRRVLPCTLALLATLSSMSAAAITVHGDLADWGVDPLTLLPSAGIEKTISDQVGGGNFRLQPGWGGQA